MEEAAARAVAALTATTAAAATSTMRDRVFEGRPTTSLLVASSSEAFSS